MVRIYQNGLDQDENTTIRVSRSNEQVEENNLIAEGNINIRSGDYTPHSLFTEAEKSERTAISQINFQKSQIERHQRIINNYTIGKKEGLIDTTIDFQKSQIGRHQRIISDLEENLDILAEVKTEADCFIPEK
ncbi:hypothetical protein HN924_03250 [Candidatus Woesearchaeota archaeon]|jgi:hypothetical protein|nr:hypothetical protein [Candidatus Woesearchaeota archaeon]MBT7062958.1 hypothetical protein [Candidatus Woesearchaeota archaeon]MBT7402560.1 hypothetical protein [Candidatus Woesearchaeota archaeon]